MSQALRTLDSERLRFWAALCLGIALVRAGFDWGFTYWQAAFMDTLALRQFDRFKEALLWIPVLLVGMAALGWAATVTGARWKLALRRHCAGRHGELIVHGALLAASSRSENDLVQSTVEDPKSFADLTVLLVTGLVSSVATAALFSFTLATVLPVLTWKGLSVHFPMLFLALALFGISSYVLHRAGRGLPAAEDLCAASEAQLRSVPSRIREHARSIAALHGHAWESRSFKSAAAALEVPQMAGAKLRARLVVVGTFLGPSDLFVLLVLSGLYFSGGITLGQLFQAGMAHRGVGTALDWFVKHYGDWAQWKSARLRIQRWEFEAAEQCKMKTIAVQVGRDLEVRGLRLHSPAAATWSQTYGDFRIKPGERVVISAPSGFGKTTLFAALARSWPWGEGAISVPERVAFVPQRSYFPTASLASAICYPGAPSPETVKSAADYMRALGLAAMVTKMDQVADWNAVLSAGEAARLALLRALLTDPQWIFLDEPTANLDNHSARLYWAVIRERRDLTVICITHGKHELGDEAYILELQSQDGKSRRVGPHEVVA